VSRESVRKEAAELAREVQRFLERERAAGLGDLLADGVAAARAVSSPSEPAPPAPEPRAAAPVPAVAPARSPAAPAGAAPGPAARSTPVASLDELEPAPQPEALDLFEGPRKPSPHAWAADPLPSFHAPLNPVGEVRVAAIAEALPILDQIAVEARACKKCGLCETRTQAVPGVGTARSGIVFVGEAPGADEDRLGEPFVGRAGQLLDRIIKAMDDARLIPGMPLSRETVYICNVLKCRPPENRNPLPHEIESCSPYLKRQLEVLKPRIICCLGKFAAELLVGVKGTIGGMRGKVYRYQGAKLIVTYHPAACLRNPGYKRPVWEDMQLVAREYQSS
jgi:DNA polymerase